MSTAVKHRTVHEIDIAASADVVYGIIAAPARWPVFFAPTVHIDRTGLEPGTERLRLWATGNGVVRAWTSLRALDPVKRTISFHREVSSPPVQAMLGTWLVEQIRPGEVRLILIHDFEAVDDDPAAVEWITTATDENSTVELANIKRLAESWDRLSDLELSFEDSTLVQGRASDVYAFLHDAALWPQRLPHVAELDLREEADGTIQLMSMWSRAKDGSTHLTESARICFPDQRIVYKQIVTPAMITAHTGEWLIEPTGDGLLVRSRHTVLLAEQALGAVPAAGSTWASTRDFVRRSIGGNSLVTLAHAKAFAESR